MTISLLKYAVRLFIRAAADVDLLRCMIFSNFNFFKFVCIFEIPKFNMNVMNRIFCNASCERVRHGRIRVRMGAARAALGARGASVLLSGVHVRTPMQYSYPPFDET